MRVHAYFIMPLCTYPGIQTPNCIRQTAFDAITYDYRSVTVIVDATAAVTPEVHSGMCYFCTIYFLRRPSHSKINAILVYLTCACIFSFFFHLFISEYLRHEEGENCNPNFTRMVCWGWGWGWCLIHLQLYHLIFKHACKWCINNIYYYLCPFANFRLNGFVVWYWVGDSKIQTKTIENSPGCSMCCVWSMFLRAGLLIEILLSSKDGNGSDLI